MNSAEWAPLYDKSKIQLCYLFLHIFINAVAIIVNVMVAYCSPPAQLVLSARRRDELERVRGACVGKVRPCAAVWWQS